ncbi:vomeronasal type-1 receptor 4-like [Peromyscus californicus insignis]|uniref:vomeronasal type-1 receptor 4-like n=1 Tax=Peromyscus californicus insignis TaxID=564181 RepID=UPI0022A6C239|nr:vomeronasal type-1 receptor 4-like [Peromyscus californicus insignis]
MDLCNLAIRIVFLSQTTTGILGNLSLMFYYLVLYYRECKLKPADLILMHLMASNALDILSAGVPHTMAVWGLKHFVNSFGCQLLLYMQRFGRSVSIGTTCLLSVFQTITINPRGFCWKDHNFKAAKYTGCSIDLLWVLYMLINFIFFVYPFIERNSKNVTRKHDFEYCSIVGSDEISGSLYVALLVCPEILFSVMITWSSSSMIVILYRHKQNVQHIRSTTGSSRTSPESRATQNILALVATFLVFYTLSSILRGCIAFFHNQNWWLVNITRFTSLCFPSFRPFVLMSHYSILSRFRLVWMRNKTS